MNRELENTVTIWDGPPRFDKRKDTLSQYAPPKKEIEKDILSQYAPPKKEIEEDRLSEKEKEEAAFQEDMDKWLKATGGTHDKIVEGYGSGSINPVESLEDKTNRFADTALKVAGGVAGATNPLLAGGAYLGKEAFDQVSSDIDTFKKGEYDDFEGPLPEGSKRLDRKSGLAIDDERVENSEERRDRWLELADKAGEMGKDAGGAVVGGLKGIDEFAEENPEAFLEIAGGIEDALMASSRNKVNAANVLAANFGLRGKIKQDNAPSALDRYGRLVVSNKMKKEKAAKKEAQQEFNTKYQNLLDAQAGYLKRKHS